MTTPRPAAATPRETLSALLLVMAAIPTLSAPLQAQDVGNAASIANRVATVVDGEVRMTYASRATACGDGNDVVAIRDAINVHRSIESHGRWSGAQCIHGPARVAVTVRDRQIVGVRVFVGGTWRAREGAVTDLGTVPARDAAAYFLSIVPSVGSNSHANPLLAAAAADSANVAPEMLRLGRMTALPRETRRRAVTWSGALGDAAMVAPLTALARSSGDSIRSSDDGVGPGNGIESAAVGALSMIPDGAGVPALIGLARQGSPTVRKAAVFWTGQRAEPAARALLHELAADERESEALRGTAIFVLGHGSGAGTADGRFLQTLFGRLRWDKLKERALMSVAQSESGDGTRWLLAQARDAGHPMEMRRKAVFWAGQGRASVSDLTVLYASTTEPALREHIIFVLSQQRDEAAIDALLIIARSDADRAMRKKALFWLAQKDDPRVTKLITDLVTR